MNRKTVLLVDDEPEFLEPLAIAVEFEFEGYRILKATSVEEALRILEKETIDLATVDVMLPPGPSLEGEVSSTEAGIFLCERITKLYPNMDVFCLSVVSDENTIRHIESFGVKFLRKGETPLRTVLNMMRSRLTGIAFSTNRDVRKR